MPIVDATASVDKLRFTSGKGLVFAPGKLGMSLQAPRQLTADDAALLESLHAPARKPPSAKRAAPARASKPATVVPTSIATPSQNLEALLDLDAGFAVTKFRNFPDQKYLPSSTLNLTLDNVTTAGSLLLLAGCMLWVARRLAKVTDVKRCYQVAEALLCFQDCPSYFGKRWPPIKPPRSDAERAVKALTDLMGINRGLWVGKASHPLPPGIAETASVAVTMVRTVLGAEAKGPFEAWLQTIVDRLQQFAANQRAIALRAKMKGGVWFHYDVEERFTKQHMGPPLPPALLDLRFTPEAKTLGALYEQFLGAVDWQQNPFLATPKELARLPFYKGTPYVPTPGAKYIAAAKPSRSPAAELVKVEDPYPFLASLDAMPRATRAAALSAYLAGRGLPSHFGGSELELEHAFSLMLGRQVAAQTGTYVGQLSVSMDVIGDLELVVRDKQARPAVLRQFEPEIDVGDEGEETRELLLTVVKAAQLDSRSAADGDFVVVTGDDGLVGRVTRTELARVAEQLARRVTCVRLTAPSDGTLFDALRYMVQQEVKPWGMSNVLDISDLAVVAIDARMEAALATVGNRELADDLAKFCDRDGRSARAWRWNGESFRDTARGVKLTFVAGVYDGEGVGMDFNVYRVD